MMAASERDDRLRSYAPQEHHTGSSTPQPQQPDVGSSNMSAGQDPTVSLVTRQPDRLSVPLSGTPFLAAAW